ncbi:(2Fe-2S)-binding protein, partial [Erythrobacter sp.]|uniref:(2Fe-2S)-binding protein n=1 Tax=Erythrobacter sp. TaxID=1042 RepID=UPI00311DFCEE
MPITINDQTHELPDDPRVSLLDFLRSHIGLTGTKKGCDHGQCGACTVIVNGLRINSCLSLAALHDGDHVTTIEGIGTPTDPSALQLSLVEHDGFQCGYCTPGMLMTSYRFLQNNPNPTEDEIRVGLSGNLCRCTGYHN